MLGITAVVVAVLAAHSAHSVGAEKLGPGIRALHVA